MAKLNKMIMYKIFKNCRVNEGIEKFWWYRRISQPEFSNLNESVSDKSQFLMFRL